MREAEVDVVGPLTLNGTYDADGTINLINRYPHHSVIYSGQWDGEGTIDADWSIEPFAYGKFALTPERSTKSESFEILEMSPEKPAGKFLPNDE